MGKCTSAIGIGVVGAVVGMCAYTYMTPKEQKHIQKGLKHAVDDLKDIADQLTEVV